MNLINKEFSVNKYNVMTVTSRSGSTHNTYQVVKKNKDGTYKCRHIYSCQWHYPGSSFDGKPKYDSDSFSNFTKDEIKAKLANRA